MHFIFFKKPKGLKFCPTAVATVTTPYLDADRDIHSKTPHARTTYSVLNADTDTLTHTTRTHYQMRFSTTPLAVERDS